MGQDYISVQSSDKKQKYQHILHELADRVHQANHPASNRSNLIAILKAQFNWWWVGYYFIYKGNNKLVLDCFQGPPACTIISKGKGVCGTCWQNDSTVIVKNVNQFPGHIACSSKSQSEIVVPIRNCKGEIVGVLDVDSQKLADFDQIDQKYLEEILGIVTKIGSFETIL